VIEPGYLSFFGIGMRNIVFRFIVFPNFRIQRAGISELEITGFTRNNIEAFLAYSVILTGNEVLEIGALANRAVAYLLQHKYSSTWNF